MIDAVNSYIYNLNKDIKVSTPFLHDTIREKRGRKNKRYFIYKWEKFFDGLHPPRDKKNLECSLRNGVTSLSTPFD